MGKHKNTARYQLLAPILCESIARTKCSVSCSVGSKLDPQTIFIKATKITDVVVAARILNATLVVPKLDKKSFWKDASSFGEIFDIDWFISHLSRDVKIIRELPHKGGKKWSPYSTRVPRKCNERCYHIRVLPLFSKRRAVQLSKFDYRLANKLETDFQKLRRRVNYHALKFADPIIKMGQMLVNQMRKMGKHFVALHLRYA